jgi:hypothetical protein
MKRSLPFVCLLALVGCGGPGTLLGPSFKNAVEYKVTSSSTARASLTYENSSGGTSQLADVVLPWSYAWTGAPKAGDRLYISAQNTSNTGCVAVEIYKKDVLYKTSQSCGAFVVATVDGTY